MDRRPQSPIANAEPDTVDQQTQQARQENIGPRQVQHKEAYIKYIANMRKQQETHNYQMFL